MPEGDPLRIPIEAELDLHAFAPADIPSVVNEYINDAAARGLCEVRLVHGRGRGVQRGIVQAALDRHPNGEAFWDDSAALLGATIARLGPARPQYRRHSHIRTFSITRPRNALRTPSLLAANA